MSPERFPISNFPVNWLNKWSTFSNYLIFWIKNKYALKIHIHNYKISTLKLYIRKSFYILNISKIYQIELILLIIRIVFDWKGRRQKLAVALSAARPLIALLVNCYKVWSLALAPNTTANLEYRSLIQRITVCLI